mgnify:CR=1 FL=1
MILAPRVCDVIAYFVRLPCEVERAKLERVTIAQSLAAIAARELAWDIEAFSLVRNRKPGPRRRKTDG